MDDDLKRCPVVVWLQLAEDDGDKGTREINYCFFGIYHLEQTYLVSLLQGRVRA